MLYAITIGARRLLDFESSLSPSDFRRILWYTIRLACCPYPFGGGGLCYRGLGIDYYSSKRLAQVPELGLLQLHRPTSMPAFAFLVKIPKLLQADSSHVLRGWHVIC